MRFVFDLQEFGSTRKSVNYKAAVMPLVLYVYNRVRLCVHIYVGFGVARFLTDGQARAFEGGTSSS